MRMYINGTERDAGHGNVIEIYNPVNMELIDTVPDAADEDVEEAVAAAFANKKKWAAVPVHERAAILYRAADLIGAHMDELAVSLSTETGKILRESRGEVLSAVQIIRGYAEEMKHFYGRTITADAQVGCEEDVIFTRHEPLGVVACIGPFNYPVELCMHKAASALAAGNCVILKPASDNPLTVMKLVGYMLQAGVPGYALQAVTGSGSRIGDILTESSMIDAVSFTGSTAVGQRIASRASKQLKHLFLELGGNDPFIVFADADIDAAVSEAAAGRLQNAGQTCCAPKRFLVQKEAAAEFISKLQSRISDIKIMDPTDPDAEYGSLINPRAAGRVDEQVKAAADQGARVLCGGSRIGSSYYQPTILTGVNETMDICSSVEIFGPVFPVFEFDTEEDAIRIANKSIYGLNAGIMTMDMAKAMRVAARLECGSVVFNASGNYRNIDQPHGGRKYTGLGREGISCTLEDMTETKAYIMKGILK